MLECRPSDLHAQALGVQEEHQDSEEARCLRAADQGQSKSCLDDRCLVVVLVQSRRRIAGVVDVHGRMIVCPDVCRPSIGVLGSHSRTAALDDQVLLQSQSRSLAQVVRL